MQGTYLDLQGKYFTKGCILEKILPPEVDITEYPAEGYIRVYLPATISWQVKQGIVADILWLQSLNWCLEKYGKQYRILLSDKDYKRFCEKLTSLYQSEEKYIRDVLCQKLKITMEEKKQFNISGYLYFAAREWQQVSKNFLAEVYVELNEEIEQENFISLLQYFVRTQPIILENVYLFLDKDGSFFLKDEYGHDLREEYLQQVSIEEIEGVSEVDLLLSILVTLLPRKIYLHCEQKKNFPPLDLLEQIFGTRIISW